MMDFLKDKKYFTILIVLAALLVFSIVMMCVALLISEKTFAQISSYIAIFSVLIVIVGLVVIIRAGAKEKNQKKKK